MILYFSKGGFLKNGPWKNASPMKVMYSKVWAMKCILNLCVFSCTEDEKASMGVHKSLDEEQAVLLASSIAHMVFLKIWELGSKESGGDFPSNQAAGGQQITSSYIAVGHRVKL